MKLIENFKPGDVIEKVETDISNYSKLFTVNKQYKVLSGEECGSNSTINYVKADDEHTLPLLESHFKISISYLRNKMINDILK